MTLVNAAGPKKNIAPAHRPETVARLIEISMAQPTLVSRMCITILFKYRN